MHVIRDNYCFSDKITLKSAVADIALRNAVLLPESEDAGKALENIVRRIYGAILRTEFLACEHYHQSSVFDERRFTQLLDFTDY